MDIFSLKEEIKEKIRKAIFENFGIEIKEIHLEYPPKMEMGDFAFPCFPLAKKLKKDPVQIATELKEKIEKNEMIKEIKAQGPYLNFFLNEALIFEKFLKRIIQKEKEYGKSFEGKGKRVMIEYLSPNTNKPLHLGHLRNGALGMALSNLFSLAGFKVIKANLINDRGIHISKSMLAWMKWGEGKTPKDTGEKGDHFVGRWYVKYSQEEKKNPDLKKEAQALLQKWEKGDRKILKIWKKMRNWVLEGFEKTYKDFGLKFDVFIFESKIYKLGKKIVEEGLKKGIFSKDEKGRVVFYLEEKNQKDKKERKKITLLREDGTSLYITQDLGTALLKFKKYKLDKSIYVAGLEHDFYFKCLFSILEALGFDFAKKCFHVSYGMVYLPEGKMKSREGKVVDADDLIEKMKKMAEEEIQKRHKDKLKEKEIEKRAKAIGVGAIKFYLLRVDSREDIFFDPKESISFDGFTGPYCQYTFARSCGILKKAKAKGIKIKLDKIDFSKLGNQKEKKLLQYLLRFEEEIKRAREKLDPSKVAIHLYKICQAFNQFYNEYPVISAEDLKVREARLALVKATFVVLKKGLEILGITPLEEM